MAAAAGGLLLEAIYIGSVQVNQARWAPIAFDTAAAGVVAVWLASRSEKPVSLVAAAIVGMGLGWLMLAFVRLAT